VVKLRLVEVGSSASYTLGDKVLAKLDPKRDYTTFNIVGKTLFNKEGRAIAKVLDVIGNVNEPYAILKPLSRIEANEPLLVKVKGRKAK
jgi:rRNA processing protein Gar1